MLEESFLCRIFDVQEKPFVGMSQFADSPRMCRRPSGPEFLCAVGVLISPPQTSRSLRSIDGSGRRKATQTN